MTEAAQANMPRLTEPAEATVRYKVAVYVPEADVDKVKQAGEHKKEVHQQDWRPQLYRLELERLAPTSVYVFVSPGHPISPLSPTPDLRLADLENRK
jgi:hypothetical protein